MRLLLSLLALVLPASAAAEPILAPADATELAQSLAEAEEIQQVCYGWSIDVRWDDGRVDGTDQGSSRGGPGVPLDSRACLRWVLLDGEITYSDENDDRASARVVSSAGVEVSTGALSDLGLTSKKLLGDDDDIALTNMVEVLPLLVAEAGAADPIPFTPRSDPLPASDRPTDRPGSDWWRNYWDVLVGGVIFLAILAAIAVQIVRVRRARHA